MDVSQYLEIFIDESAEHLQTLSDCIMELEKEPDNNYDKEAIQVKMKGLGKIGYVANSPYTVIGESRSAGRLYDKIGDTAAAKVVLITPGGVLCKVCKKSLAEGCKNEKKNESDVQ